MRSAFPDKIARMAELVDALVSNTCGKPCRFEPGSGYINKKLLFLKSFFLLIFPVRLPPLISFIPTASGLHDLPEAFLPLGYEQCHPLR